MASRAVGSERPWRCFVAVPIPDRLRAELAGAVAGLRADAATDAAWRWTDPTGWHLTLAFLGATDPARIPKVASAVSAAVSELEPFSVAAGGFGVFPSRRAARVLWYGVNDADGLLRLAARDVRAALGLDEGERFRPHLTLARARARYGIDGQVLVTSSAPVGEIRVDRAVLFRSHRSRGPARYEELAVARFGAPVIAGVAP